MKSFQISLIVMACMLFNSVFSQQITINGNVSAQQLIENHLIQGCVETSNIDSPVNGSINGLSSFGYFERGDSNFPFKNGIMLSTGKAVSGGNGPKEKMLHEGDKNWENDTDLEAALGLSNTINATAIEFDFSSISNHIQFNYLLASEEYYGNFPCEISDGFAFLIKEAGTNDPYVNIALIPGTTTPVNTNTIHNGINNQCGPSNADFFEGYALGDTNYNGRTKVMTATASILPNVTYHIKLVIADYMDENYDSAVFIEGNSFNAYVDLGNEITTCADQVTINGDINNPSANYFWFLNNAPIDGETQSTLTVNQSGDYTVKIEIPIALSSCTIEDSINIKLSATQTAEPISDFELCDDSSSDGIEFFDLNLKTPDVINSVPKSTYSISYHWSYEEAADNTGEILAPVQNQHHQPTSIHVRIEDKINGCLAFSTFNLVVNSLPEFIKPTDLIGCADDISNGLTAIDLTEKDDEITNGNSNLKVSYHHTVGDANSGDNAISSPYNNRSRNEQLYVRVENVLTSCAATTTLIINVLDKPVINTNAHFIDACDPDHNGFAAFDLTTITPDVLVGITGVSTSFHETYDDALSGSNAIPNPNNYTNTKKSLQIVYIRVTDDVSGCASVTPIEIHANLLLTGTLIKDFSVCEINDGEAPKFDLNDMEETIVNELPDVTVDFYESPEDQAAEINALNKALPYRPSPLPKKLYITLRSSTCSEISEIELIMNPRVDFPSIGSVTYCDTDQDLLTLIDLGSFSSAIANGEEGYSVRYFTTENDAKKNINQLPNFYQNLEPTITIYTRTIANATGCSDVKSFEITVLPAPETKAAEDIIICDDDQDGFSIINLNKKISEIISDLSNRSFSFHTSLADAESGTNAIVNPAYYSSKTATVYTRVQSTLLGECHSIEPIKIIVNTLPIIPQISNYIYCEDEDNGFGDFIFKTKDAEILNEQKGKSVSYYLNPIDAETRNNPIDKNKAFNNTISPQTIHVRVENITDETCYSTGSFFIEVGKNPKFNAPRDWFECDDISNDGRGVFHLSYKISEIKKDIQDNLNITFYTSLANAEKAYNPIPLEYTNTKNPQLIYARIDNGSICAPITTFNIGLTKAPEANPSKPLEMCSPDANEKMTFDLTLAEFDILDVRQYNLDIQYYA
ncbi:MAG: choice-of-anchor L domain-containing protein, partial [Gelidibacter sp.]